MPNKFFSVAKIVSGGQTGADRAAWDFSLENRIPIGGTVPRGRVAEDGPIDVKYGPLTETATADPAERTRQNVAASDATLIFTFGEASGGTRLTLDYAEQVGGDLLVIDLSEEISKDRLSLAEEWLRSVRPGSLNIAGPRASEEPRIYGLVKDFLTQLMKKS